MTTLDAIVVLLLIEALLAVAWAQACKARRLGVKRAATATEAKDEPSGPQGPVLSTDDRRTK